MSRFNGRAFFGWVSIALLAVMVAPPALAKKKVKVAFIAPLTGGVLSQTPFSVM